MQSRVVSSTRCCAWRAGRRVARFGDRKTRRTPAVVTRYRPTRAAALFSDTASLYATRPLPLPDKFFFEETPSARLRVAVDVDEVLGQFLVSLNSFCQERYGMTHDVQDYHVYHFATVWDCSQETSTQIVHEFFESPYFHQLPLVPGAFEALCEMQEWCDLYVVTSRQHVIKDITIEWLSTHYPGIFTSVHFGNHFALDGATKKKSEMCKEIEADVLIDDNPDYALECASSGIHVILYNWQNAYPWSRMTGRDGHDRIQEVSCWSDVPHILRRI